MRNPPTLHPIGSVVLAFLGLYLSACGALGSLSGGSLGGLSGGSLGNLSGGEARIEGRRLDLLQLSDADYIFASGEDRRITLPPMTRTTRWERPALGLDHRRGHEALSANPQLVWRQSLGSGEARATRLTAQPLVADGRIYALDAQARLSARQLRTGTEIWARDLNANSPERRGVFGGGLALSGGLLYFASGDGRLYLVQASNGEVVRSRPLPAPSRAAPLLIENLVLVQTIDNILTAYDAQSLAEVWSFEGNRSVSSLVGGSTPAWHNGTIYAAFSDGELVALDPKDGSLAWSQSLAIRGTTGRGAGSVQSVRALPVISDEALIASSFGGGIGRFESRNGDLVWEVRAGTASTPAVTDRYLFLIASWGEMIALTQDRGALVWRRQLPDVTNRRGVITESYYGPVLANRQLIAAGSNGTLIFVDAVSGEIRRQVSLGAAAAAIDPLVVDTTLLVVTSDGQINAFR